MKFMMSCRQPLIFLKEAEEIRVNYNDIERLKDFVTDEWTCQADIVIYIPKDQIINWDEINLYKDILKITIAAEDTDQLILGHQEYGYSVFWAYPISTYWELRSILNMGVSQVLLDAPLYFDLPKVKSICGDVEIRLVVNKCYNNYLPHENGICGTYVRPEDIEAYSAYVDHFQFDENLSLKQEHTIYNIYTKDKAWPGNLNILLTNFNVDVDNRGFELVVDEDDDKFFAHRRMTCGQKCQGVSPCSFCQKTINFINVVQKEAEKQKLTNA